MPDETPKPKPAIVPPKPAAKPTPPPEPQKVVVKGTPQPEPVMASLENGGIARVDENTIVVWYCEPRGLWYARIGPDRLGVQGQGRDSHEALAECVSNIYRSQWQFDPSWKPKS